MEFRESEADLDEKFEQVLTDGVMTYVAMRMLGAERELFAAGKPYGKDFDRKMQELVDEGLVTSTGDDGVLTSKGRIWLMGETKNALESETPAFPAGCEAYELKLTFLFDDFNVWRTIKVPSGITFDSLHSIIQATIGWFNSHLYEFSYCDQQGVVHVVKNLEDDDFMSSIAEMMWMDMGSDARDDEENSLAVKLSEVIPTARDLTYLYDYGDSWEIDIKLVGTSTLEDGRIVCTGGEGDAPCEDMGGELGYRDFLRIMNDPEDPEYKETVQWASAQGFETFDVEKANGRLASWDTYGMESPLLDAMRDREYYNVFIQSLDKAGVSERTFDTHADNIECFIVDYLEDERDLGVEEGIELVSDFLGEYMLDTSYELPSLTYFKSMITSVKKFYKCMLDNGYIEIGPYREMIAGIKEHQQEWFDFIKNHS